MANTATNVDTVLYPIPIEHLHEITVAVKLDGCEEVTNQSTNDGTIVIDICLDELFRGLN